jgi:hypothetical protein
VIMVGTMIAEGGVRVVVCGSWDGGVRGRDSCWVWSGLVEVAAASRGGGSRGGGSRGRGCLYFAVMPFAAMPQAEPVTSRDKRLILVAIAVIVLVLAGVGIWAAVKPGAYGKSAHGCITVTLPSSTGGALIHQCGPAARATCRHAFTSKGKIAALTRPQCRLAGLAGLAAAAPRS